MATITVGIREFRAGLAQYIATRTTVAVARDGETIGYFIPAPTIDQAALSELKQSIRVLDKMLSSQHLSAEALAAEFDAIRKPSSIAKRA